MPTWIRCRDDVTGHEFDVRPGQVRPGITPIEGYAPNSGRAAKPRPAKTFVAKDGKPAQPKARKTAQSKARKSPASPASNKEN
jgi:hypothetical protein